MKQISSSDNEKLKQLFSLYKDGRKRSEQGLCVVDGAKLCADLAYKGIRIRELWLDEDASVRYSGVLRRFAASVENVYILSGNAARRLSDLKAPQGVFAVTEIPAGTRRPLESCRRILGLCEIQNPENAAAAVRTAAALGYDAVMLTADCADIWSPRSIRAGAGAQFSLDIHTVQDMCTGIKKLKKHGFLTLASALTDAASEVQDIEKREKLFIAVGNEGHGLPDTVIEACDETVIIPMSGMVESLNANAAASILMWELR